MKMKKNIVCMFVYMVILLTIGCTLFTDKDKLAFNDDEMKTKILAIGVSYQGGIIAYILQSGDPGYVAGETHGLIAAAADQTSISGIIWAIAAYQSTSVSGTGTALGTGSANTDKIIAQNGAGSTYAAGLARAYNGGGYTDWYLPSKDELTKIFLNKTVIGGFQFSGAYWSSSQSVTYAAFAYSYAVDAFTEIMKYGTYEVRAVRSF
jgi:hypothetical protein